MFLEIMNNGTVSRKFFELIGATQKRGLIDDPNTIGNKGSGAKISPIPLLRLGYSIAVTSSDNEGSYILGYETQTIQLGSETDEQVMFKYHGNGTFPSQMTLRAFQDWDKPIGNDPIKVFKALREYFVNAWDEDKGFTFCETDHIRQAPKGMTVVYLTLTDEIRHVLDNMPRYFKIIGDCTPLLEANWFCGGGKIYPKSDPKSTRLFSQGVLVSCTTSSFEATVFDYSLGDKSLLSEERIIMDLVAYREQIGRLLQTLSVEHIDIVVQLFAALLNEKMQLEAGILQNMKQVPKSMALAFSLVWQKSFGEKAILPSSQASVNADAKYKGYDVIENIPYALAEFLKRCGISNASDVAPVVKHEEIEKPPYEEFDLTGDQQSRYNRAYSIFLGYFPEASRIRIHFYRPLDFRFEGTGGHTGIGAKENTEIWIAEISLKSDRSILKILVHEWRHCRTKLDDYDRNFVSAADDSIVDLMLSNPDPVCENEWTASVIKGRGILIPSRFIGQQAFVTIRGKEVRFEIGPIDTICAAIASLPSAISGQMCQNRKVVKFHGFGCIFVPGNILVQLPSQLNLNISSQISNPQSIELVA